MLLIDHANCEEGSFYRLEFDVSYVEEGDLLLRLSALAREELRHFEQVGALAKRDITYRQLSSARYVGTTVKGPTSCSLIDLMVVSGVVEAKLRR